MNIVCRLLALRKVETVLSVNHCVDITKVWETFLHLSVLHVREVESKPCQKRVWMLNGVHHMSAILMHLYGKKTAYIMINHTPTLCRTESKTLLGMRNSVKLWAFDYDSTPSRTWKIGDTDFWWLFEKDLMFSFNHIFEVKNWIKSADQWEWKNT